MNKHEKGRIFKLMNKKLNKKYVNRSKRARMDTFYKRKLDEKSIEELENYKYQHNSTTEDIHNRREEND